MFLVYRGGHWDFRFCGFGYFLEQFSVFVPKNLVFSVLVFIAVYGFSKCDLVFVLFFLFLISSTYFSAK